MSMSEIPPNWVYGGPPL